MSGSATPDDSDPDLAAAAAPPPIEVSDSREADVGGLRVRRALPRHGRRTIGAWCFVDHMGPVNDGYGIGPHPHIGLQTVTWLLEGEGLHRDSLGSEQVIRPGQLNLMTAGHGVAHAEEPTGYRGRFHGVQLWVAQPAATRDGSAAFEHHAELPQVELDAATATVILGELAGHRSPARRDTDHVGVDLDLRAGTTTVPVPSDHEHGVVVLEGAVEVGGQVIVPGQLAYLPPGRDELGLTAGEPTRALLIGGTPFPETVVMWWNYVARDQREIVDAHQAWTAGDERFGSVDSTLGRIDVAPPPWPARPAPPT